MTVLELSDESRALRDAARGWSTGRLALEDYRTIRRATLAAMLGCDPDEEDSAAGLSSAPVDVTESVPPMPAAPAPGVSRVRLLVVAAIATVMVVGGLAALILMA